MKLKKAAKIKQRIGVDLLTPEVAIGVFCGIIKSGVFKFSSEMLYPNVIGASISHQIGLLSPTWPKIIVLIMFLKLLLSNVKH